MWRCLRVEHGCNKLYIVERRFEEDDNKQGDDQSWYAWSVCGWLNETHSQIKGDNSHEMPICLSLWNPFTALQKSSLHFLFIPFFLNRKGNCKLFKDMKSSWSGYYKRVLKHTMSHLY